MALLSAIFVVGPTVNREDSDVTHDAIFQQFMNSLTHPEDEEQSADSDDDGLASDGTLCPAVSGPVENAPTQASELNT